MSDPVPPSVNVTHTVGASDATTIYLTQGRTRFIMQESEPGTVNPRQAIEWVHTLAMSPQAAYQLMLSLSTLLQDYSQRYGAIPEDKAFVAKIIGQTGPAQ